MNTQQTGRWATGPFTLIELLVVVAIIAVLAAMLLPALARAREQAMRIQCTNQHRQVVLAAVLYAEDHDSLFPRVDGSWIQRYKNGPNVIQGVGLLAVEKYIPLDRTSMELMFCPSSTPTWNWQQVGHMYNQLTTGIASNVQAHGTTVGKFCTFVGYNTATHPTQANLYLGKGKQRPAKISPILSADYVFDGAAPWNNKQQGHMGKGTPAGFYDGSVQYIRFTEVYHTGRPWATYGTYGNVNPYGQFWHWAHAEYGE